MSNEITFTFGLTCQNGSYKVAWPQEYNFYTQNAQGASAGILQTSSGSVVPIPLGSVATPGFLILKNLENSGSVNYVDWGISSGGFNVVGQIKGGEINFVRVKPSTTVAVQAEAGSPLLQYWLLED